MLFALFSISYLVTSAYAAHLPCSQASIDAGINGCGTPGSAAGHMNQGYQGGAPGSAAAGHMNQAAPGSAAATGQTPNPTVDCSMFPGTGAAKTDCLAQSDAVVPDVLPNASNCCTLLIKLGDTFNKVC